MKDSYKRPLLITIIIVLIGIALMLRSCSKKDINEKNFYTIGRDSSWHNVPVFDKNKSVTAFTNDIIAEVSKNTQINFLWVETDDFSLFDKLRNGSYDAIMTGLTPNPYNRDIYSFSNLLLETGPVLLMKPNAHFETMKDIDGKTIGLAWETTYAYNSILQNAINSYHLVIITYNNPTEALTALANNSIDGVVMNATKAYSLTETLYKGKIQVVTRPLTDEGIRLVSLKDESSLKLIETFNNNLEEMKKNGIFDELLSKWGLIDPENRFLHSR